MARVAHLPDRGPATGRPLVLLWLAAATCAGGILACLRSGWTDETVRDVVHDSLAALLATSRPVTSTGSRGIP
jgi:hypothetical protein